MSTCSLAFPLRPLIKQWRGTSPVRRRAVRGKFKHNGMPTGWENIEEQPWRDWIGLVWRCQGWQVGGTGEGPRVVGSGMPAPWDKLLRGRVAAADIAYRGS